MTRSRTQVSASCRNLPPDTRTTRAVISLSCGGYVHDKDSITTEFVKSENPVYESVLMADYMFEAKQFVNVAIYAYIESDSEEVGLFEFLEEQDEKVLLLAAVDVSLGRVIHGGGEISSDVPHSIHPKVILQISIKVQECITTKENIVLKLQGLGLDKKDLFGKSDPYIYIERFSNNKFVKTYRTEVVKNTLNPDWKPLKVSIHKLCFGDLDSEIKFRCFDWDGAKGDPEDKDTEFDDLIGEFSTTCRALLDGTEKKYELEHPKKQRKKRFYRNSGVVMLKCIASDTDYSFLDYMFGGTDMNFIVAIDLTASNGDVTNSSSLHFSEHGYPTEYEIATQAVLEIVSDYDSDQLFPAYGFGAKVPPDFKLCHDYPLNGDYSNPFCVGTAGVLEAYKQALSVVKLSGPTHFSPVIRNTNQYAKNFQDGSHYVVLLILTDGTVDDWAETKKAVIEASYLPISIIVVGIGGGKFSDMVVLDQDEDLLKVGKLEALRDNVQFVRMRKYIRPAADGSSNVRWNKVALTKDVLNELPDQVIDYMTRNNIKPKYKAAQLSSSIQSPSKSITPRTPRHQVSKATPRLKTSNKQASVDLVIERKHNSYFDNNNM